MANRIHASLCILMFLLSVSLCALGFGPNQIHILNEKNDISFHSTVAFDNNTAIGVPPTKTLIQLRNGTAWDYVVPQNTTNILTTFEMVNASGHYYQNVWTWSDVPTPWDPCTTNCSWKVDGDGFSVTSYPADRGVMTMPQFIVSWNGPYPSLAGPPF